MRTPNNVTRNTLRRLAFTLFAAVMGCVTTWADSWTSGDCTVTLEGATLTVTKNSGDGNGAMADYTYSNEGGRGWKSSLSVVTSIVIESGVTTIGDYSFSGFNKLTSVTIPASVTSIGQLAFNGCTSLTSVTLLEGMKNIGNSAFNYCTGLSTVTIPEGVETIGNSAFRQCTSLGAVTIPESVTRIGEYAFYSCSNLARVIISNGVTIIDNYAFQQCTSLTSVFIPVSVTEVGQQAFSGCSNLASVTILTKSLTRFGSSAFDNNASGRKIYVFANYLSTLGTSQNSWKKYKDAGDITALPTDGTHGDNIKYSLFDCDFDNTKETLVISGSGDMTEDLYYNLDKGTITNAIIENGVTSIGKYAFYNCIHLASITIPASVTSIDRDAFKGCWSLVSLNIPASVTSIGQGAFIYCTGLTSVTIPTSVTSIGNSAFESCTALTSSLSLPA